jgi:hypothetical protein
MDTHNRKQHGYSNAINKKIKNKSAPRLRAMLEPVLSEVPPNSLSITRYTLFFSFTIHCLNHPRVHI